VSVLEAALPVLHVKRFLVCFRMAEDFDAIPAEPPTVEVKLFGKWSSDEVHVNDISLSVRLSLGGCWPVDSY